MKVDSELNDFLILLSRGMGIRKLYFAKHNKVREVVSNIIKSLNAYFQASQEEELFVGIIEGTLIYNGRRLTGPSVVGHQLVQLADRLSCGGFTFLRTVSVQDIARLLDLNVELSQPVGSLTEARQLLLSRGINNITVAYKYSDPSEMVPRDRKFTWMGKDADLVMQSPDLLFQALFDVVESAHGNALLGCNIDIESAKSVSEYLLQYTRSNFSDIMQHIHYPNFDTYTVGHSVRVASLAVYIGTTLGLDDTTLLDLGTAALLHDVGKSKIPEEILFKPDRLTDNEFAVMKGHSPLGAEILLGHTNTTAMDIAVAWGHHIHYNGKGYPELPDWLPRHPLTALMQICDVFEALTAIRPYKPPFSPHEAYSIMLADKGTYHPALLAHFIAVVGLYPPGNVVKLSDGRKGVVVSAGKNLSRPQIEISVAEDSEEYKGSPGYRLDLASPESQKLYITGLEREC
ncbi:HD domain-containing protein [Desulfopila aestuarii DSM 18488]|uniref:HD domain-containing protein n=2 Tax=Desulfopila aestuarii TaxID=231440 RepID=A0A1M7XWW2_9BACT|nr:HD domain-containing protein [Desulfopila aestuarii DSM 18488]